MGLLETGMTYLATQLAAHTEVPITYSRSTVSMSITATRGTTPYEASDSDGIIHRTVRGDYLIRTSVFPFTQLPLDGDVITDDGKRYLVQSIPGEHPWRFVDPAKTLIRVHTKEQ